MICNGRYRLRSLTAGPWVTHCSKDTLNRVAQESKVYKCDRCAAAETYEGRIRGFDGTYLDETWRGFKFHGVRVAWEFGEIDITWWCRECLSTIME